jgi:hypothetical protein
MKRKCKNIDISDVNFIESCANQCLERKGRKAYNRSDVRRLFSDFDDLHSFAIDMSRRIKDHDLRLKKVRYMTRSDRSNDKKRLIMIEDIEQQILDYVVYNSLEELESYIGHYQIACRSGMGPIYGVRVIHGWLKSDDTIRYAIKADIKKCYPSIKKEMIMAWLNRHVKNDELLWLIEELLSTCDYGLPIGSYMSIRLCALYVANLYHHIEGTYFTQRRGKMNNIFSHVMINLDDIYIFGSNAKEMNKAFRSVMKYSKEVLGLEIKEDWKMLSFSSHDSNAHIDAMGYRIYRNRITMRRRNYVKLKSSAKRFRKSNSIKDARSFLAREGMFARHTNSKHFCMKYNIYHLKRKARKGVSEYDKGNDYRKARSSTSINS